MFLLDLVISDAIFLVLSVEPFSDSIISNSIFLR